MSDHDLHDRGLAFDLETIFDRRHALKLFAGAGLATLIGCGSDEPSTSSSTPTATATASADCETIVYVWHCDRAGGYSLYSEGITDQNYLRGVQEAGADGKVTFTTIFPAAYMGRWPHIHFEVYASVDAATGGGEPTVTTQLALPEDVCTAVYATEGYEQSVQNLAQTSLDGDMVFSDGADAQLAAVEGDVDSGYTAMLTVAV